MPADLFTRFQRSEIGCAKIFNALFTHQILHTFIENKRLWQC